MQARWAFLGTGRITQRMLAAIGASQSSRLVAIASRSQQGAEAWLRRNALETSHVQSYSSYKAAMQATDVEWMYVATPPSTHCDIVIDALKNGKHVLCEKPLGVSEDEAERMLAASIQYDRKLLDATGFPYHLRTQRFLEIIASGTLGQLRKITIACSFSDLKNRPDDHRLSAELGGGCLLDLGWYCVYASLYLSGQMPLSILAHGESSDPGNIGGWQTVQSLARFPASLVAHWDCSFQTAGRRWIEIAGEDGTLVCDDLLRPGDLSKPRFWIHDAYGKAQVDVVGVDDFQEANLIDFAVLESLTTVRERFGYALRTQQVLQEVHRVAAASSKK